MRQPRRLMIKAHVVSGLRPGGAARRGGLRGAIHTGHFISLTQTEKEW
jgi:hypothetical protein